MNRNFNSHLRTALFFVFSLLSTVGIGGSALINNQTNHPRREQEIPIPADGDCLYKSIMVAYLLPVVNDAERFNKRLAMLNREDVGAIAITAERGHNSIFRKLLKKSDAIHLD